MEEYEYCKLYSVWELTEQLDFECSSKASIYMGKV